MNKYSLLVLVTLYVSNIGGNLRAAPVEPVVRYQGPISSAGVARLERELAGRGQTLVITSEGGNGFAAIRMASLIRARGVKVVADKYCMSGCASHILPAGYSSIVKPNTFVAFHNTMTSTYLVARSLDPELAERRYAAAARAELDLYRKLKINPILLTLPVFRMGPVCAFVLRAKDGKSQDVLYITKNKVYLPGRALLGAYGYPAAAQLPASESEMRNAFRLNLPPTLQLTVRADFASADRSVTALQIEQALTNLPVCTAEAQRTALSAWRPPPD
ncbi:MAG: hypothetical protein INE97_00085 [Phenylobacterium sp.]|nr:hypothetical protein [Phenylobacterium sp.]MCA6237403.1 hypothetical protein [Phenylobacterium sp.]